MCGCEYLPLPARKQSDGGALPPSCSYITTNKTNADINEKHAFLFSSWGKKLEPIQKYKNKKNSDLNRDALNKTCLSSYPPLPPSCRRGAAPRGWWLWTSWLTGARPARWSTWCRWSSPSSRETSYPCCPKRCLHATEQTWACVQPGSSVLNVCWCFAVSSVRVDLPGSQRPAAGCSDLPLLEDPGWRQPAVEGEVPRGR